MRFSNGLEVVSEFELNSCALVDDLHGSVGSIADLKPKGPGFESRISQGFFLM
jgi:hypothetical protein